MISDDELIEQANRGNAEAFETLYHRHRDWVYRLAWRFTGNQQDALDVLQETFFYLLGKFPGLQLTASLTTFLYPVVKHLSLNVRHRRSGSQAGEDVFQGGPIDPKERRGIMVATGSGQWWSQTTKRSGNELSPATKASICLARLCLHSPCAFGIARTGTALGRALWPGPAEL